MPLELLVDPSRRQVDNKRRLVDTSRRQLGTNMTPIDTSRQCLLDTITRPADTSKKQFTPVEEDQ